MEARGMTMEGDPRVAAQAVHRIRGTLHNTLLALMGREDIQAARRHMSETVTDLSVAIGELDALARVNGLAGDPFALAAGGDGSEPTRCGFCRRLYGSPAAPCINCPDYETAVGSSGAPPRCVSGRCPDDVPCINHCGTGQCSRCCTVCRRLAGAPTAACPACPDRPEPELERLGGQTVVFTGGRYQTLDGQEFTGIREVNEPEPPPGIPSSDLDTDLVPWSERGAIFVGVDQGVRVTHVPTGVSVISSDERSQLQNKARALGLLGTHPVVGAYIRGQRCTHGGDCTIHPGTGGLHNYDGTRADQLPVHRIPGDKRDPR
jgi:hypothetical protein